ncbi:glycosyltransferase family 2 protein [Polaribacter sp.]|uniref:glycosyltransferase family 2 protein n=1 Tax=Polaribacter sp. TaxID=1920175 RepID=UPI003EF2315E
MEECIKPLVSILIPMYNSEDYINETLDSCLSQKYKNIEIIIVDDESTDSSYKICETYAAQYKFIKVYKQLNSGAPAARNLAFKKSKGEFIQYLDADDLLSDDKIEGQINILKNEDDSTISYCKYSRFTDDIEKSILNQNSISINYTRSITFFNYLLKTGWLQTSCWLVPRKLIISTGDWRQDLSRNQDGDFFGRVILNSKKGIYSNKGEVFYRILNPNSITAKKKDVLYFESYIKSFYLCADFIILNGKLNENYYIAKMMNGLCERLVVMNSKEVQNGIDKINDLGFASLNKLQHPIIRILKYVFGYRISILIKMKILKLLK